MPEGVVGYVQSYFGGLAADEPRAALVARDVLSAGGTAADAAVALYFALAVTMPSAAGLGGGGVCVVHGSRKDSAEAIEFLPLAAAATRDGLAVAVPGAVRGIFALHARYGVLRWENLLRPAERLARFGVPVSRAFARELARGWSKLAAHPETARAFAGADGRPIEEGEVLRQVDLGAMLGLIRTGGPGEFYNGSAARIFVDGARSVGAGMTMETMRAYRPRWIKTLQAPVGHHTAHFPGPPVLGGEIAAALWRGLDNGERYADADAAERPGLIAEAATSVYRGREAVFARDVGTTGFVIIDRRGGSVACALTMNGAFGTARLIPRTGILAVPPSDPDGADSAALAPVLVINRHTNDTYLAGVASLDAAAPVALVSAMLPAVVASEPLESALGEARLRPGGGNVVLVEERAGREVSEALRAGGYSVRRQGRIGRVNLMYCAEGMERTPESCDVRADQRYFGYAINAEF